MKNSEWIITFLVGCAIGALILHLLNRPPDLTATYAKIERLEKTIEKREKRIMDLSVSKHRLDDSIVRLRESYLRLIAKPSTPQEIDSLQNKAVQKGRARYVAHTQTRVYNSKQGETAVYANVALDELGIYDLRFNDMTKIIGIQQGVVLTQDSIITTQAKAMKKVNREFKFNKAKTFLQGGFFGFLISILFLL